MILWWVVSDFLFFCLSFFSHTWARFLSEVSLLVDVLTPLFCRPASFFFTGPGVLYFPFSLFCFTVLASGSPACPSFFVVPSLSPHFSTFRDPALLFLPLFPGQVDPLHCIRVSFLFFFPPFLTVPARPSLFLFFFFFPPCVSV